MGRLVFFLLRFRIAAILLESFVWLCWGNGTGGIGELMLAILIHCLVCANEVIQSDPPRSAHQALLDLERGTGQPDDQLDNAAEIIGLDLSTLSSDSTSSQRRATSRPPIHAPKDEWALRWLQKRLRGNGANDLGYKLNVKTWLIFGELIDRVSAKKLARILSEMGFLTSLKDTVSALSGAKSEAVANDEARRDKDKMDIDEAVGSKKRGKKRKRNENEDAAGAAGLALSESEKAKLFTALVSAVAKLVRLAKSTGQSDYASIQHVKLVLKAEPAFTASVLQAAIMQMAELASVFFEAKTQLFTKFTSFLALWSFRSTQGEEGLSDEAFTSQCLYPALKLLQSIRETQLSAPSTIASIEKLVALHVVLPLRKKLFTRESAADETKFIRGMAAELVSGLSPQFESKSDVGTVLPLLFDIAIRSSPRDTFRRQQIEAQWLEAVLVALAEIGGFPLTASENGSAAVDTSILRALLQLAIDKHVAISLETLSSYASSYPISPGSTSDWPLTASIISLGVDVFVPNSGIEGSSARLQNLVSALSVTSEQLSTSEDEIRDLLKNDILIPLVNGFARARDLSSFIALWQEQLRSQGPPQKSATRGDDSSLWEDQDLISAFEGHVTELLATGQIENPLRQTQQALSGDLKDSAKLAECFAAVVIANALVAADYLEETLFALRPLLQDLFNVASKVLQKSSKKTKTWRWHLWRLVRNIYEKLARAAADGNEEPADLLLSLAEPLVNSTKALLGDVLEVAEKQISTYQYLEVSEAFHFAVVAVETLDFYSVSVQAEPLLQVLYDFLVQTLSTKEAAEAVWNGRSDQITTQPNLAMSLLSTLMAYEALLRSSSSQFRKDISKHLIQGVTAKTTITGAVDVQQLNFGTLLSALTEHKLVRTDIEFAQDITVCYLDALDAGKSVNPNLIKGMLALPSKAFPRTRTAAAVEKLIKGISKKASSTESAGQISLANKLLAAAPQRLKDEFEDQMPSLSNDGEVSDLVLNVESLEAVSADVNPDTLLQRGQIKVVSDVKRSSSSANLDQVTAHISRCRQSLAKEDEGIASQLLVLATLLSQQHDIPRSTPLGTELSSVFNDLTSTFTRTSTISTFCLATECLDILLRQNSPSISQYNIDNILAHLSIACSSIQGPQIDPVHSSVIFVRLCRLTGLLISTYRQKLGGRWHLVLPVLQNLLACLFVADKRGARASATTSPPAHPPWLSQAAAITDPKHITHYTRLLTLLADPTVSSANQGPSSNPSGSSHLTDATARARSIAGRYLQYLLATYVSYTLHGSIAADVKTALMPGLYIVIDCMARETMRAMNAGLGAEGRAVWRGLYDEWRRFGRWDKS